MILPLKIHQVPCVNDNNTKLEHQPLDRLFKFAIKEDFDFPGYNGAILKKGDTLIAPAYWAYYFLSEHTDQVNAFVVRKTS